MIEPRESAVLDEYDRQAILALVIKQIRAQDVVAREAEIRDAAIAAIKSAQAMQAAVRDAMKAFGFDPKSATMWDDVREGVGKDLIDRAFAVARESPPEASTMEAEREDENAGEDVEVNVDEHEGDGESETGLSADGSPVAETKGAQTRPDVSIRELVLERLAAAGNMGSEAAPIKRYVEGIIKSPIHEKTVGMTLWRLSKLGFVRREGRTWFRVSDQESIGAGAENEEAPAAEAEEAP
jgi:hypothetical protein